MTRLPVAGEPLRAGGAHFVPGRLRRGSACALTSLALLLVGCAPAVPVLAGGSTTPQGRAEVALGGAVRVPLGDLAAESTPAEALLEDARAGGVSPVASVRFGLSDRTSVGLMAAGPLLRAEIRYEVVIDPDVVRLSLHGGLAPYVGHFSASNDASEGSGARVGIDLPFVLAVDVASVGEAWGGLRVGAERAWGTLSDSDVGATGLMAGAIVGVATGFRHLHALFELSAGYERWIGEVGGVQRTVEGFALTPAFALRLRL